MIKKVCIFILISFLAVACKDNQKPYEFEMTTEISTYLDNWLGDNPYPEACRPASYFVEKMNLFSAQPARKGCTIMLGDSITDFADLDSLFPGLNVLNRGIAGDLVEGITLRLDEIARHEPSRVFFLAGCNNFVKRLTNTPEDVCAVMDIFFSAFREKMAETPLFVQSLLPMNSTTLDYTDHYNSDVEKVNEYLIANQRKYGYEYIDIASPFKDDDGCLKAEMTDDGCHPNKAGYEIWAGIIKSKL